MSSRCTAQCLGLEVLGRTPQRCIGELKQSRAEKRAIKIEVHWISPRQKYSTGMPIYFFQPWFWSTRARPPVSMLHLFLILHSHILQCVSRTCRLLPPVCSLSSYQAMRFSSYSRALPDSTSASEGASISSYPESVNWFLETYAEPHALAVAKDTSLVGPLRSRTKPLRPLLGLSKGSPSRLPTRTPERLSRSK